MSLRLEVDGDEVALYGTERGNETHAKLTARPWVWSRRLDAFVLPRSLRPDTRRGRIRQLERLAEQLGVALEVEDTGRTLSEAERRESRTERLEVRAERHDAAAVRHAATSEAARAASDRISDGIPMGQPILVGHHSERRARRDIERMHRLDRKWIDEGRAAEQRERLAEGLRRQLANGDPTVTIQRRIERHEADIRRIDREVEEHELAVKIAGTKMAELTRLRPCSDQRLADLAEDRQRLEEAVEIDRETLAAREADGEVIYSRENVAKGGWVRYKGLGWFGPISRVNAKSVTVPSIVGGSWTDTLAYTGIVGFRSAEEVAAAKAAAD